MPRPCEGWNREWKSSFSEKEQCLPSPRSTMTATSSSAARTPGGVELSSSSPFCALAVSGRSRVMVAIRSATA
jgi:hypothetical protein